MIRYLSCRCLIIRTGEFLIWEFQFLMLSFFYDLYDPAGSEPRCTEL